MANPPKIRPSGPPLPTMAQLLAAHDAAVQHGKGRQPFLASDGSPLAVGSHINPKPTRHQVINGVQLSQVLAPYTAPVGAAPAPLTITPGDPADIGPVIAAPDSQGVWSPGNNLSDVNQGFNLGDCYYLQGINGFAFANPAYRRLVCARVAPGQYLTNFFDNAGQQYRVLSGPNISANGQYNHPNPTTGAFGGCIAEKAFAWFRDRTNTYADLNEGYWGEPFGDHGCSYAYVSLYDPNFLLLMQAAQVGAWAAGAGTFPTTKYSVASHAYTFGGITGTTLANCLINWVSPWGFDNLVLTLAQTLNDFSTLAVVNKYGPLTAIVGDVNSDGVVDMGDLLLVSQRFGQAKPGGGTYGFGDLLSVAQQFGM